MTNNLTMIDGRIVVNERKIPPITFQESVRALGQVQLDLLTEATNTPSKSTSDRWMKSLQTVSDIIVGTINGNNERVVTRLSSDITNILSNKKEILSYSKDTKMLIPNKLFKPAKFLKPRDLSTYITNKLQTMVSAKNPGGKLSTSDLYDNMISEAVNKIAAYGNMNDIIESIYGEHEQIQIQTLDRRRLIEELESFQSFIKEFNVISFAIANNISKTKQGLSSINDAARVNGQIRCYAAASRTINTYMQIMAKYYTIIVSIGNAMIHNR